ncbi:Predicted membrane protein [Ceraceosorus bombacis]|uniref:Predicted membrane protein n=1 Tax=Ceraceosorus bombacis TaxID=401625 RepID=A0A0P1BB84_9BASI|nr:Predicted membrane protein [Ceraceosorus bombacis]
MTLISILAGLGMAIGAPLIYADQAWSIQKKRDSSGFSKDVCAVLLLSNIARCFFWLGEPFELALLLQSILMIAAQLFLLSLLLYYRPGSFAHASFTASSADAGSSRSSAPLFDAASAALASAASAANSQAKPTSTAAQASRIDTSAPQPTYDAGDSTRGKYAALAGLNFELPPAPTIGLEEGEDENDAEEVSRLDRVKQLLKASLRRGQGLRADGSDATRPFGFWTWTTLSSYIIFLLGYTLLLGVLQMILGWSKTYVSILGYYALGLESTLPIPQAISNQRRRSLSGFRLTVLGGWTLGDVFKTGYFIVQGSPPQFLICALFALSIDLLICAQAYLFREQTQREDEEAAREEGARLAALEAERGDIGDYPTAPSPSSRGAPKNSPGRIKSNAPTNSEPTAASYNSNAPIRDADEIEPDD